jgi:hypothetical protein
MSVFGAGPTVMLSHAGVRCNPTRALSHAQKSMVKCSSNYNAGIDYEKRVKR